MIFLHKVQGTNIPYFMKLGLRDVGYYTKKDVAPYPIEPNGKSSFLKSDKKPKKAKYKIYVTKSMKLEHNQGFQALIVLLTK